MESEGITHVDCTASTKPAHHHHALPIGTRHRRVQVPRRRNHAAIGVNLNSLPCLAPCMYPVPPPPF
jgi:hypothetical protein